MLRRKWKLHQIGKYRDTEWLETMCNSDGCNSWVNYTSDRSQKIMSLLELNTVFPIKQKQVYALATQYHCMRIIKNIVSLLNPDS